jgi:cysteine-rich repeat protein
MACASYTYDAEAIDSDSGHTVSYSDPNSTLPPLNLSLNTATGLISGQPQNTGDYTITVQAQDQYQAHTIAPYQAASQQTYTLTVTDEVFALNPISDNTAYVNPSDATIYGSLYHGPIIYDSGALSVTTSNHVTYDFYSISPALLPSFFLNIDNATGEMQGSPTDNNNDPNNYTITVQATNDCGAMATDNFVLTILPNQWCGDSIVQTTQGEECDDGNTDNTDSCDTSGANPKTNGFCSWTFCGDQTVQTPNHYGVNEQCDDGADGDDTNQCYDDCTLTYCGDGVVQIPNGNNESEQCDDGADGDDTNQCYDDCTLTYCGDGIVQNPNGNNENEECEFNGSGTGPNDQYECSGCSWAGSGWCGDGIIQTVYEQCELGDLHCGLNCLCETGYVYCFGVCQACACYTCLPATCGIDDVWQLPASCAEIYSFDPSAPSGYYTIDTDGSLGPIPPTDVWCSF